MDRGLGERLFNYLNKQFNSDLWFFGLQFWVSHYLYDIFAYKLSPKGALINSPGH